LVYLLQIVPSGIEATNLSYLYETSPQQTNKQTNKQTSPSLHSDKRFGSWRQPYHPSHTQGSTHRAQSCRPSGFCGIAACRVSWVGCIAFVGVTIQALYKIGKVWSSYLRPQRDKMRILHFFVAVRPVMNNAMQTRMFHATAPCYGLTAPAGHSKCCHLLGLAAMCCRRQTLAKRCDQQHDNIHDGVARLSWPNNLALVPLQPLGF
jgi:hypothetical protein